MVLQVFILLVGFLLLVKGADLSLIHISEPTRRTPISYAVFCLKKKSILYTSPSPPEGLLSRMQTSA